MDYVTYEQFLEWAKTVDPDETYNWMDPETCPCAMYAKAHGLEDVWRFGHGGTNGQPFHDVNMAAIENDDRLFNGRTYRGLVKVLERKCAEV